MSEHKMLVIPCPRCGEGQFADNPDGGDKSVLPHGKATKFQIELPDNSFQCGYCGYAAGFDVWEAIGYEAAHNQLRAEGFFNKKPVLKLLQGGKSKGAA